MNEPATYVSFLVRLWREPGQASAALPAGWHGEIESIHTSQRWALTTLNELLSSLRQSVEQLEAGGWSMGK